MGKTQARSGASEVFAIAKEMAAMRPHHNIILALRRVAGILVGGDAHLVPLLRPHHKISKRCGVTPPQLFTI
ncbi:MAG: hypothetical protein IJF43_05520, partial [Firmicutes bacterium]|nr:hypothetical protein [Bacillota bacterium]